MDRPLNQIAKNLGINRHRTRNLVARVLRVLRWAPVKEPQIAQISQMKENGA